MEDTGSAESGHDKTSQKPSTIPSVPCVSESPLREENSADSEYDQPTLIDIASETNELFVTSVDYDPDRATESTPFSTQPNHCMSSYSGTNEGNETTLKNDYVTLTTFHRTSSAPSSPVPLPTRPFFSSNPLLPGSALASSLISASASTSASVSTSTSAATEVLLSPKRESSHDDHMHTSYVKMKHKTLIEVSLDTEERERDGEEEREKNRNGQTPIGETSIREKRHGVGYSKTHQVNLLRMPSSPSSRGQPRPQLNSHTHAHPSTRPTTHIHGRTHPQSPLSFQKDPLFPSKLADTFPTRPRQEETEVEEREMPLSQRIRSKNTSSFLPSLQSPLPMSFAQALALAPFVSSLAPSPFSTPSVTDEQDNEELKKPSFSAFPGSLVVDGAEIYIDPACSFSSSTSKASIAISRQSRRCSVPDTVSSSPAHSFGTSINPFVFPDHAALASDQPRFPKLPQYTSAFSLRKIMYSLLSRASLLACVMASGATLALSLADLRRSEAHLFPSDPATSTLPGSGTQCFEVSSYTTGLSTGTISLAFLVVLQASSRFNLHSQWQFMTWISLSFVILVGGLVLIGIAVTTAVKIGDAVTLSEAEQVSGDPQAAIRVAACSSAPILAPAVVSIAITLVLTIGAILAALDLAYQKMVFMRPTVVVEEYRTWARRIKWVRSSEGSMVPLVLILPNTGIFPPPSSSSTATNNTVGVSKKKKDEEKNTADLYTDSASASDDVHATNSDSDSEAELAETYDEEEYLLFRKAAGKRRYRVLPSRLTPEEVELLPSLDYTLIYSHGNACDLGVMGSTLQHLARHLNCAVVVYDYPGYGPSSIDTPSGLPSERHVSSSLEAVFRAVTEEGGALFGAEAPLPRKVILHGRSIGTGVTIHLAALLGRASRRSEFLFLRSHLRAHVQALARKSVVQRFYSLRAGKEARKEARKETKREQEKEKQRQEEEDKGQHASPPSTPIIITPSSTYGFGTGTFDKKREGEEVEEKKAHDNRDNKHGRHRSLYPTLLRASEKEEEEEGENESSSEEVGFDNEYLTSSQFEIDVEIDAAHKLRNLQSLVRAVLLKVLLNVPSYREGRGNRGGRGRRTRSRGFSSATPLGTTAEVRQARAVAAKQRAQRRAKAHQKLEARERARIQELEKERGKFNTKSREKEKGNKKPKRNHESNVELVGTRSPIGLLSRLSMAQRRAGADLTSFGGTSARFHDEDEDEDDVYDGNRGVVHNDNGDNSDDDSDEEEDDEDEEGNVINRQDARRKDDFHRTMTGFTAYSQTTSASPTFTPSSPSSLSTPSAPSLASPSSPSLPNSSAYLSPPSPYTSFERVLAFAALSRPYQPPEVRYMGLGKVRHARLLYGVILDSPLTSVLGTKLSGLVAPHGAISRVDLSHVYADAVARAATDTALLVNGEGNHETTTRTLVQTSSPTVGETGTVVKQGDGQGEQNGQGVSHHAPTRSLSSFSYHPHPYPPSPSAAGHGLTISPSFPSFPGAGGMTSGPSFSLYSPSVYSTATATSLATGDDVEGYGSNNAEKPKATGMPKYSSWDFHASLALSASEIAERRRQLSKFLKGLPQNTAWREKVTYPRIWTFPPCHPLGQAGMQVDALDAADVTATKTTPLSTTLLPDQFEGLLDSDVTDGLSHAYAEYITLSSYLHTQSPSYTSHAAHATPTGLSSTTYTTLMSSQRQNDAVITGLCDATEADKATIRGSPPFPFLSLPPRTSPSSLAWSKWRDNKGVVIGGLSGVCVSSTAFPSGLFSFSHQLRPVGASKTRGIGVGIYTSGPIATQALSLPIPSSWTTTTTTETTIDTTNGSSNQRSITRCELPISPSDLSLHESSLDEPSLGNPGGLRQSTIDIFPSLHRIGHVRVPVFISHGTDDTVVPFDHGVELLRTLPPAYRYPPCWLPGKGHNDMPKYWLYNLSAVSDPVVHANLRVKNAENKECLLRIKAFMEHCDRFDDLAMDRVVREVNSLHGIINDVVKTGYSIRAPPLKETSPVSSNIVGSFASIPAVTTSSASFPAPVATPSSTPVPTKRNLLDYEEDSEAMGATETMNPPTVTTGDSNISMTSTATDVALNLQGLGLRLGLGDAAPRLSATIQSYNLNNTENINGMDNKILHDLKTFDSPELNCPSCLSSEAFVASATVPASLHTLIALDAAESFLFTRESLRRLRLVHQFHRGILTFSILRSRLRTETKATKTRQSKHQYSSSSPWGLSTRAKALSLTSPMGARRRDLMPFLDMLYETVKIDDCEGYLEEVGMFDHPADGEDLDLLTQARVPAPDVLARIIRQTLVDNAMGQEVLDKNGVALVSKSSQASSAI